MTGSAAAHADAACHDLLVRLAGRLPDDLLWRLRDWLAAGAGGTVAGMLPRVLLRGRVDVTDAEHALLTRAVEGMSRPNRLLDAVPTVASGPATAPSFRPVTEVPGPIPLSVAGIVRGHPGCRRVALARRVDPAREQDVWLVHGGDRPWALAGTVARVLRAHGDRTPCVEVLTGDDVPTVYHRVALAAATPLWRCDPAARGVPVHA